MPKPHFQFKQFAIWHDKCAMKVNTDGILLGAWADITAAQHILDVGTGSGLIALMLAQRSQRTPPSIMTSTDSNSTASPLPTSRIYGVELDSDAAQQAQENFDRSPWRDNLIAVQADITDWRTPILFDHIVSNPPFFIESLQNQAAVKTQARHQVTLTFDQLLQTCWQLTKSNGRLSLVLPVAEMAQLLLLADEMGWQIDRMLDVSHQHNTKVIRQLVTLVKTDTKTAQAEQSPIIKQTLAIRLSSGEYSEAYQHLCRDFYLRF